MNIDLNKQAWIEIRNIVIDKIQSLEEIKHKINCKLKPKKIKKENKNDK